MLQRNPSSQLQGDKPINQMLLANATVFIAPFLCSKMKVAEVETLHHKKIKKSEKRFQKRFQIQISIIYDFGQTSKPLSNVSMLHH